MEDDDPASYRPIPNRRLEWKTMTQQATGQYLTYDIANHRKARLARLRPQISESVNLNKLQSVYQKHHSTETALLNIMNNAYAYIDKGQSTLLVAVDLSAAYDTVEHSMLLT